MVGSFQFYAFTIAKGMAEIVLVFRVICNNYVSVPLTGFVWKLAGLIGVYFPVFKTSLTGTSFVLDSDISSGRRLLENGRSAGFFLERSPFGCYFICPFVVVADCCIYLDTSVVVSPDHVEKKSFFIAANQVRFIG